MIEMEGEQKDAQDVETDSGDSFIDDSDDEPSSFEDDEESVFEAPLTDAEIEEIIADFLEVESKAAEAQESLEKESLAQVESEVRQELGQTLQGEDLEMAVSTEMKTFIEEWEMTLDDLEAESALLLEQLDGAGIELPSLYKWIESQAPNGCCTEAWRKRAHWVGSQISTEANESITNAEKYLQSCRPVRRQHGRLLEEGASGFLGRKLAIEENDETLSKNSKKDWSSFKELIQSQSTSGDNVSFGSKHWASVYLASTPQQAANMGLKLPGVDEVEEINDIDGSSGDPFYEDAVANEKEIDLSEEQKKNFRKVKEEDDINIVQKLQLRLKKRRRRHRHSQEKKQKELCSGDHALGSEGCGFTPSHHSSQSVSGGKFFSEIAEGAHVENKGTCLQHLMTEANNNMSICEGPNEEKKMINGTSDSTELNGLSGSKRSLDGEDLQNDNKRCRTVIIDSDDEVHEVDDISASCKSGQSAFPDKEVIASESFHCTICSKVLRGAQVQRHPLLEVIICENCKFTMEERMKRKDPDCSECYCVWCGMSYDLVSCKSCKSLFCTTCIKKNLGEQRVSELQASGWRCCCCSPNLLQSFAWECSKALQAGDEVASSSDSGLDLSYTEVDVPVSNRKRRKRRIRRILDDAELGEETKRKIAIEKARQEHLKSLQVQNAGKSWGNSTAAINGNLTEAASIDIMGDLGKGYIVNVAREEGEEPVRIPPSISAKLKPHQISGIRFMWENIIQSVRKVRSGDRGLGCILAHTMGLGKTFQVIAFLYASMRIVDLGLRTALIVTPVNVLHNWRQEFIKWRPVELKPLRILMLEDVPRDRRAHLLAKWRTKGGVLLIGYAAFRNLTLGKNIKDKNVAVEISHALQNGPDILVCDEAHMIKNTRADTTQALKQVKCQRRIALTGSPLQNNLMEYYCMVDFVREGFLGSSHEFRNRFQNPIENGQHANSTSDDVKIMNQRSHILYEQLKGFVQRMDMSVVKKDLPPKVVFVITVKLSPLQRKLYKKFLDVHGFTSGKVSGEKAMRRCFFAGYQTLAQIWNHPGLLQMAKEHRDSVRHEDAIENFLVDDTSSDDNMDHDMLSGENTKGKNGFGVKRTDNVFLNEELGWWKDLLQEKMYKEPDYSGKMVLLLDILSMCSAVGDKALVFSQSLTTLDLIELFLSRLPRHDREGKFWIQGKDWYRMDGSTQGSERQRLVEKFNEQGNKRVKCALISTRAGSLGINLHAANRVILIDGSWNPTHDLQAIYRAWRYGQNKPVYAYRLMAHGTMEEKIYKRQVTKEGLAARVVDRQQVHRTMSKEEILHLFDFGDDENADCVLEKDQKNLLQTSQGLIGKFIYSSKQNHVPVSQGGCSSDKFMENLLSRHYPRWIANYHEHEMLLQENEAEKLSKEEQDMAWEVFQRSLEWEEVQRVTLDESASEQKPVNNVAPAVENIEPLPTNSLRNRSVQRKCTNLAHMLTLRSQGTKPGCSTICGECALQISWENKDGKPV